MDAGPEEPGTAGRGRGRQVSRTRVKLPPDPYGDETPRRPIRFRALAVLLSVAVLLTVAAVVNHRHSAAPGTTPAAAGSTAPAAAAPSVPVSGGPTTIPYQSDGLPQSTADRIPIGYPDSAEGAESAATNYVSAYGSSSMVTSSARTNLVNAIADPSIATEMTQQLNTSFAAIQSTYGLTAAGAPPAGLTFVERTVPVGVTLVKSTSKSTTVSVWVVTMSGLAGTGSTHPVTEEWWTVTVELDWVDNDWKWFGFSETEGPTPVGGDQVPSAPQALQSAINQFGGLRYAR